MCVIYIYTYNECVSVCVHFHICTNRPTAFIKKVNIQLMISYSLFIFVADNHGTFSHSVLWFGVCLQ